MTMRREEESDSWLGALVVGALIGAGLAYAFAPRSGSDTRRRLGHWLHEHGVSKDLLVKLKKVLTARHNGHNGAHAVNGRTSLSRRHGRS